MASTAELQQTPLNHLLNLEASQPFVIPIAEMPYDAETRSKANEFILGAVAVGETVSFGPEIETRRPIDSLFEAIKLAANGATEEIRQEARKLIEINVRTDVIERTIKSGHVLKVELSVNDEGKISQFGQSMDSIQANSLRFASGMWQMRERTEAETRNSFRIEKEFKSGKLNEYSLVVISRAADNMTTKEMNKAGFFTDTMSTAVQVTTAKGGKLTTESAFMSGAKHPGGERHDAETIAKFGDLMGVNYRGMSATETLDTPILIHNSLIPNGAIDVAKIIDSGAGTFFGEDKPPQDYEEYLEFCKQRELTYEPKVQQIVEALIAEAEKIVDHVSAKERLGKLSEKHMVEMAVEDENINPLVFGEESAAHIVQARAYMDQGHLDLATYEVTRAKATAKSSSCPNGGSNLTTEDSDGESTNEQAEDGDCEFISEECPLCHAKKVKTLVTKDRITCGTCKGYVKK
jgi:hypothetical protein